MDATWLWTIPALPFAGAALNGVIAILRRWTPGSPDGHPHDAPADHHSSATAPAPLAPAAAAIPASASAAVSAAAAGARPTPPPARIRLPGEKRDDPKPASHVPTHAPHGGAHGPNLAYAGAIATGAMLLSFACALTCFIGLFRKDAPADLHQVLFTWIRAGSVEIPAALLVDHLTALMLLVITGVGSLIHIYSLGYMAHDKDKDRYFAYLNLFAGMMLILVMGDSLPLLFVGWEGVGLCSYLLIGFWYTDLAKAKAGKKAFVVNRVGDAGFLLGMFVLYAAMPSVIGHTGTLSYFSLHHIATQISPSLITAACLLLFVGACGKSAQFPLYIWLPDAMAGPTPVSALIHAATMVTAGVYMIARLSFLFSLSPTACAVVASVGAFTALFAASMGFVQNDVKKVLAYSTVSQLGFMVLAVGSGAYTAGVFHLMTHAFFKALLFLAAGSLIHSMQSALPEGADPNDIRSMGGLRHKMPWTYATFACGWAAICGIPFTSGFFSKDQILGGTLHSGVLPEWLATALFTVGLIAAGCTAFYMTRLFILIFFGAPRMGAEAEPKVHESPSSMTGPMALLAVLSIVGGYLWIDLPGLHVEVLTRWLSPALASVPAREPEGFLALLPTLLATSAAGLGILLAWAMYVKEPLWPKQAATWLKGVPYEILWKKYGVDEAVEGLVVMPVERGSRTILWRGLDVGVIDGLVNGVASAGSSIGGAVSRLQTGLTQNYAVGISLGVAGLAVYLLTRIYS